MRPGEYAEFERHAQAVELVISDDEKKVEHLEDLIGSLASRLNFSGPKDVLLEQLADIQDAIYDALWLSDMLPSEVERARAQRYRTLGGYVNGVFVRTIYVDPNESPELYEQLIADPAKYPTQVD